MRDSKGAVILDTCGFEGKLPGASSFICNLDSDEDVNDEMPSARTRPFIPSTFRKRKLVQIANLHNISKKAAKPR